jgi:hypothetical protein
MEPNSSIPNHTMVLRSYGIPTMLKATRTTHNKIRIPTS